MQSFKTETWGEQFWQNKSSKSPEVRMNQSIIAGIFMFIVSLYKR